MLGIVISRTCSTIIVGFDVSSKFSFQGRGLKVKVTVAILKKNFVIALCPSFNNGI